MPPLYECIEFENVSATMRFHFVEGVPCWNMKTICGVEVKDNFHTIHDQLGTSVGKDGFIWDGRHSLIEPDGYDVIYCGMCGVEPAGTLHDDRTRAQRRQQREELLQQRDQQEQDEMEAALQIEDVHPMFQDDLEY